MTKPCLKKAMSQVEFCPGPCRVKLSTIQDSAQSQHVHDFLLFSYWIISKATLYICTHQFLRSFVFKMCNGQNVQKG